MHNILYNIFFNVLFLFLFFYLKVELILPVEAQAHDIIPAVTLSSLSCQNQEPHEKEEEEEDF